MLDLLTGFVQELRAAGLPVSTTESVDAMEAVRQVPLDDREALKHALGATLVKNAGHRAAFETVFEVWFSPTRPPPQPEAVDGAEAVDEAAAGEDLARLLHDALEGDEAALRALAREAVRRHAGMRAGRHVGGTYYLYRTLRRLDVEGAVERALARGGADATALERRLARDELAARAARLRAAIEAEIRRALVADRGSAALARTLRRPLPEDVDFMHASRDELAALRRALYPLTRRLAARLARRRRRGRTGPLDFRSTLRHSLSYGGVPAEPKFRRPRPAKPELMVVADVSGSVAAFARFTLQLAYAISSQFSRVRSFVFIDGVDEVTRFFEGADDLGEAVERVNTEADVVWVEGHSDYGNVLETFWARWGREVTPRTTVILLGDARNNYHESRAWVLRELGRRARHLYWLNPEPRAHWDTGDSIMGEYALHCDGVFECRNLRQLERFVEELR